MFWAVLEDGPNIENYISLEFEDYFVYLAISGVVTLGSLASLPFSLRKYNFDIFFLPADFLGVDLPKLDCFGILLRNSTP